jgi:8-amino-7-oxononanoate synthase
MIVVEGCYSMDGDAPDIRAVSEIARRYDAWLLVDEAHSLGVLGERGLGVREEFGLSGSDVDFWMGTLSKTLAGCGGYIAGSRKLVEYLKLSAPGFVYSVGMPPPVAAASLAALQVMHEEPQRVAELRANATRFLEGARAAGFDTGLSQGYAIVPVITGSSIAAARFSQGLLERGVNVQPILYPAVPERSARLRFFLSSEHSFEDIDAAIAALAEVREEVEAQSVDLSALASRLSGGGA